MRRFERWRRAAALLLLALCLALPAAAAETAQESSLVTACVTGQSAVFYLSGPGTDAEVTARAGETDCPAVTLSPLEEVETVILVDRSVSIPGEMRELTRAVLTDLVGGRMEGERMSIAAIGDGVRWLCRSTSDYAALKEAIDSLEYRDQSTYLTGVICEAVEPAQDGVLRRLVILADGENTDSLGHTWDEVDERVRSAGWPVYTLLLTSGATGIDDVLAETTQELYELAQMSGGAVVLATEGLDSLEIAGRFTALNSAVRVEVPLPDEVCDGQERTVELTVTGPDGAAERCSAQLTMPLVSAPEEPEEELAPEEPETGAETAPSAGEGQPGDQGMLIAIAVGAALLAALLLLIVRLRRPRAPETKPVQRPAPGRQVQPDRPVEPPTDLHNTDNAPRRLRLTDRKNPNRSFDLPLGQRTITVGRGPEKSVNLHGENSVSRKQCAIFLDGCRVMLQNQSQYGTGVDRKVLRDDARCELTDGCIISMGTVSLEVELL